MFARVFRKESENKQRKQPSKERQMNSKVIKLLIAIVASLVVWCLPTDCFGIVGLTVIEHRVIALFVFAALMWMLEAIPIWTTSVLVIVLMLLTVSDSQLIFLNDAVAGTDVFGTMISHKSIMASFADPIVMLFLGGFALAIAATKSGLDLNLARVMLKPFGTRSEVVLLGFMIVTAMFSMFMSNTATAAMMLTILAPVMAQLPKEGKGRIGLAMAIPIAANVGGIGTPIGTPPNAIAIRYIQSVDEANLGLGIDFGQWMAVMVPFVIVILGIAWFMLIKMFPFSQRHVSIKIDGTFHKDWRSIVVYVTFAVTVLLWVLGSVTGLNSNVVALIPFAAFTITGVIGKQELREMNWDVLWLVAGGFALGTGLQGSGLAKHLVESIPFDQWPPLLVFAGSGLICYLMSTFMSNTASAALLIPILATVAKGMENVIEPFGGASTMLIGVALSASLAMALPISTPPNALAYSTGAIKQMDMVRTGLIIGVVGIVLGYLFLMFASNIGMI